MYDILLVIASIYENQMKHPLVKAQKQILKLVVERYPQVYLVGGTALSFYFNHRVSEDLDFFTQQYTAKLHKEIARYIKQKTDRKSVV